MASALLEAKKSRPAKHGYFMLCPHWSAGDFGKNLRDWVSLDSFDDSDPLEIKPRHLRAAVVNWASIENPLEACGLLRNRFPNLPMFIVVGEMDEQPSVPAWTSIVIGSMPKYLSAAQGWHELLRSLWHDLDEIVDSYLDAPYWDVLRRYAKAPSLSFHTRTIGNRYLTSDALADFSDFYGETYFAMETSLATAPLDSLLKPKGAIRDAQLKAAKAFGAALDPLSPQIVTGTRFVSCGTSTANRIVVSAWVQPGEFVLMERTGHISHHYALAYAHAKPVFLEGFRNTQGLSASVPLETVQNEFRRLLETHNTLPSAIILSNPTFDGFFCRPDNVIEAVVTILNEYWEQHCGTDRFVSLCESLRKFESKTAPTLPRARFESSAFVAAALRRIVFLFDEAWSAAAFFHPQLIEFTAMHASLKLTKGSREPYANALRIYSTQSTHKSLCALRQGSMIHFRDPLMARHDFSFTFEQSFRAHTTTSPSASIIASLDVARRHAQLEVTHLQDDCLRLAKAFRREFEPSPGQNGHKGFFAVTAEQMMACADTSKPALSSQECFLTPTHITLSWSYPVDGGHMRRRLLKNKIQVNKYDQRSLLVIFNVGVEKSDVERLHTALRFIEKQLDGEYPETIKEERLLALPEFSGFYDEKNDVGFWAKNLGGLQQVLVDIDSLVAGGNAAESDGTGYVAAAFVTPYPPGHPVLIPGQIISDEDIAYLRSIGIHEVLGAEKLDDRLQIPVFIIPEMHENT